MRERIIPISLNSALGDAIKTIQPLDSPNRTLLPASNIYTRPPSYLFRFKSPNSAHYEFISQLLTNFEGNLKWTMVKVMDSRKGNYFIEPKEIATIRNVNNPSIRKQDTEIIQIIGDRIYDLCDLALLDVEQIAKQIITKAQQGV
jgi:hypothetical protein